MHLKFVVLWILTSHLAAFTEAGNYEVNVTRPLDPSKGDKYFISSEACAKYKCSHFGGVSSGDNDCNCECPNTNATFSKHKRSIGCFNHVHDSEECKLRFPSQTSGNQVKTLRKGQFEILSVTKACTLVYVKFLGVNGTWSDVTSSQKPSFNLLHGRRGQTVSTALEIKLTLSKALDGAIIKLGTSCGCLVFKLEGTRICVIPVVDAKPVDTTTATMKTEISTAPASKTTISLTKTTISTTAISKTETSTASASAASAAKIKTTSLTTTLISAIEIFGGGDGGEESGGNGGQGGGGGGNGGGKDGNDGGRRRNGGGGEGNDSGGGRDGNGGGQKREESQKSNDGSTTTTDLIVIGACAAAAILGISTIFS